MTYSLLMASPDRRLLAVATATCTPAVGHSVPGTRLGVGGVVSQAHTNSGLRDLVLDHLATGATPADALVTALATDNQPELRQLGVMNADGVTAAHVGAETTPFSGARSIDGALAIGNYLAGERVLDALIAAADPAALPEDLSGHQLAVAALTAMRAAQAAGGDRRGQQSAAMTIIEHPRASVGSVGRIVISLAIDDDPTPLERLERLLRD